VVVLQTVAITTTIILPKYWDLFRVDSLMLRRKPDLWRH